MCNVGRETELSSVEQKLVSQGIDDRTMMLLSRDDCLDRLGLKLGEGLRLWEALRIVTHQ